jgi:hypothetical protein
MALSAVIAALLGVTASPALAEVYHLQIPSKGLRAALQPSTLGEFAIPAKMMGDAAFALTPPSSNSIGGFSYTSSNPGVATVAGDVVTLFGVGTTTITAVQAASSGYASASTSAELRVNEAIPTLSGLSPATGSTAGGNTVTLSGTGFRSGMTVSWNGVALPQSAFTVQSPTAAAVTVPAGAAGAVSIRVSNASGASSTVTYTYVVPGHSLVGNGTSKAGACASGLTGCAIWNMADKGPNVSLTTDRLGMRGPNSAWEGARANKAITSGKWYWETTLTPYRGIATSSATLIGVYGPGVYSYRPDGVHYLYDVAASPKGPQLNASGTANGVLGFALDMDNKTLTVIGDNGSYTISGLRSAEFYPWMSANGGNGIAYANFGQSAFTYAVPSGYNAGVW